MPDPLIPAGRRGRSLVTALWLAYVAVMLYFALGPTTVQTGLQHGDKLLHFLAFAGMAFLYPWPLSWSRLWLAALVVVGMAGGIEIVQDLSPAYGRHPELLDFLAGVAGGSVGLGLRFFLKACRENA